MGNGLTFRELSIHIANDCCSVKATAAHIAFDAPSRSAVNAFFAAALKAGGRIHGEPAVRDQETGYYSAAVLDFDENSIEAMHRERSNHLDVNKQGRSVLSWQEEVARSTIDDIPQVEKPTSRVVVNNISTPTTVITRNPPQAKEDGDMSAKTLVGTLLGAAAGAAVAYAMAKGEAESVSAPAAQTITYQTVETSNALGARSTVSSRRSYQPSSLSDVTQSALKGLEYPQPSSIAARSQVTRTSASPRLLPGIASASKQVASTLIDTFIPPSEIRYSPPHAGSRSRANCAMSRASSDHQGAPSATASQHSTSHSKLTCAPSAVKTVTHVEPKNSSSSSVITEIKVAREIPLPSSAGETQYSRGSTQIHHQDKDTKSELASVAPSDSVSQAGSRRSKASKPSNRHGHSRLGLKALKDDSSSRTSAKSSRQAGSRTG